ncbi:hypothetical protein AEP_02987 [Curvibacter sp. AEP1-3]|nr:hypothetical protein AEP_02987 [Curvibacter sp. AEP1-3]
MKFSAVSKLAWNRKSFKIVSLITAVIFGYPLLLESANYAIPERAELTVIEGEISEIRGRSPHITLVLQDQSTLNAEFPVQSFARGHHDDTEFFYSVDSGNFQSCKKVAIRGQYLKFYPLKLWRIWEIECIDNSFRVTYETVVSYWAAKRNYVLIPKIVIVLFFAFPMLFLLALDARRLHRNASNEVPSE